MGAMTATAQMTATEFLARPLDPASQRWELIDGELVMSQPQWTHNAAQLAVAYALQGWARAAPDRGRVGLPLDVQLDERNVYEPDVVWYRDGRAPVRGDRAPFPVPDLAVEVRSPATWRYDIGVKKSNYERYGVAELWLIDTAADVVLVFRRSTPTTACFDVSLELAPGDTLTSPLLPGFSLAVGEIFASDA
jgi:Uma2 family endonuclease